MWLLPNRVSKSLNISVLLPFACVSLRPSCLELELIVYICCLPLQGQRLDCLISPCLPQYMLKFIHNIILIAVLLAYPDKRRRRKKGIFFLCSLGSQRIRIKLNTVKHKPVCSALFTLVLFLFSFSRMCVSMDCFYVRAHDMSQCSSQSVIDLMSISASVQSSGGWLPQIPSASLQKGVGITSLGSTLDFILQLWWPCYIPTSVAPKTAHMINMTSIIWSYSSSCP